MRRLANIVLLSVLAAVSTTTSSADLAVNATPLRDSDFTVIQGGRPYDETGSKIEVVEFFNYICPACNVFEPLFQEWKAKLPKDVHVIYVPADFREDFSFYARVYYAAELLGLVEKTHDAVYKAIHEDHKLPGEGESLDAQRIANFYVPYGTTAQAFVDAMNSFTVNTHMNRGNQFEMQCQLESTPTLVISGKYMVKGKSFGDSLRIASQLIERERNAARGRQVNAAPNK